MTAVAGILIPSILTHAGVLDLPAWYEAGKINDANNNWDWSAFPLVLPLLTCLPPILDMLLTVVQGALDKQFHNDTRTTFGQMQLTAPANSCWVR